MKQFATKEAKELLAIALGDRDHAEPSDLENYYSPDESEEIFCTTKEREDWEMEAQCALTEDVVSDQSDYDSFVRYLAENCDLGEY